ncbi:MAG TPA: DUF1579 domain-containing protein [Ignavibacteriaceae bacterium]|nr:DUF1579 domain-containing protein [Ignavibacteriaceae bacterium]
MFKHFLILSFLAFVLLISTPSIAQENEDEMAAEQQAWMEYMTPGPMHEMLMKASGEWKSVSKFWMDPSGEPMVSEGAVKFEMILGGRYMKSTHTGTMMGMPFEGIFLQGYDNATNEFTAIWIDNMGTGTSVAKGKYDEASKSIMYEGTMVDPMSKQELKYKQSVKFLDDNHHLVEMFMDNNGIEFKMMETDITR